MPESSREQVLLGRAVLAARARRGWTQEQLALASGLTRRTITSLENGQTRPAARTLALVSEALGTTVEDLLAAQDEDAVEERVRALEQMIRDAEAELQELKAQGAEGPRRREA